MPKKIKKKINWADDSVFDKSRAIIYIEYADDCFVFKEKANELLSFVQERFPEWNFVIVKNMYGQIVPRPESFEVSFSQNARMHPEVLWSGINKGPPRADKFPKTFEEFIPKISNLLKQI
ncbi:selenoprotein BthD [Condylostylus longicornis]|uniref:selenoprotein BthD n=1 Tax=Condylostylus longicornis TaxID=2530218 RepID=UPI00244E291D|nr:selenoprotein BthD [Condylostylus longicornis]